MSRDQIADLKDDLSGQIKELGLVKADVYDKHAKQAANMGTTVFDLLLKDALGLATRQLDVFGYYKFVTAVSNINLLPDREDRIKKEKKKHTNSSLMTKLTIISATLLALSGSLYGYLFMNVPSSTEIAAMTSNANALKGWNSII